MQSIVSDCKNKIFILSSSASCSSMLIFFLKTNKIQDYSILGCDLFFLFLYVIKIFDEHKKLYRNAHSRLSQTFKRKVLLQKEVPENLQFLQSERF